MSVIVASISWFVGLLNCLRHVQISPFSLNLKFEDAPYKSHKLHWFAVAVDIADKGSVVLALFIPL